MKIKELARKLVAEVEREVNDRRGIKWDTLDEEVLTELRDALADRLLFVIEQGFLGLRNARGALLDVAEAASLVVVAFDHDEAYDALKEVATMAGLADRVTRAAQQEPLADAVERLRGRLADPRNREVMIGVTSE